MIGFTKKIQIVGIAKGVVILHLYARSLEMIPNKWGEVGMEVSDRIRKFISDNAELIK